MSADLPIGLAITDDLVDALADLVAERLAARQAEPDGYLDAEGAAEFLACDRKRVWALVSEGKLHPSERDGRRLLFTRADLRAYLAAGGAKRR